LTSSGIWPWQDLYAVALVADDHVAEATEFLTEHEAPAAAGDRPLAQARLAAQGKMKLRPATPNAHPKPSGTALRSSSIRGCRSSWP